MSTWLDTPLCIAEELHGTQVTDPYRWLEDRTSPQTECWIREQQQCCHLYFSGCPDLTAIRNLVRGYLDVEIADQPARVGHRLFFRRQRPRQEQACIYVRDTNTNVEQLLVDPSSLGKFASLAIHRISDDGTLLAYEVRYGGEDKKAIHIVNTESRRIVPDKISVGYTRGFAFTAKNDGFYYCQETADDTDEHKIWLHFFQRSKADQIVFRAPRAPESRLALIADSANLAVIWSRREKSTLVADLFVASRADDLNWKAVYTGKEWPHLPLLCYGRIFVLSSDAAQNSALIELAPDGREIRKILTERASFIQQVVLARDRIYISFLHQGVSSISSRSLTGETLNVIELPKGGSIQMLPNHHENEAGFFFSYESFAHPPAFYEYTPDTNSSILWHRRSPAKKIENCATKYVSFRSKDGTEVPLTLVSLHPLPPKISCPVIMTSYGGFGVSMTPQFSVLATIMMKCGAIFAMPHIRGGGDLGRSWHDAGRRRNKQVAFDDFITAAEWLSDQGITTSQQLAIFGGSNAGLLVGAAMTQRPELFRAVVCIAPLLDMVRYETFPHAAKWRGEYGTVTDPDDFRILHSYSPYHRIERQVDYPPVLFVAGDKDDRCDPAHVRKMAARLQGRETQTSPVVVDYTAERGHSPTLPLTVRVEALARRIAFLCKELGIQVGSGGLHEATHH